MTAIDDNHVDDHVDVEITAYLNLDAPKSFFLFAGAGSGKTRSLVEALKHARNAYGRRLRLQRKKVAVITYTNAACDEIKQRLDYEPIVEVSTIHSFIWSLIHTFHADIKQWLKVDLQRSIEMAGVSADEQWKDRASLKTLMLEHHMAARRMGFADIFDPLYEADDGSVQTALLEGTLPGLRFFSEIILTLRAAVLRKHDFAVAALVRDVSPLVSRSALKATSDGNQIPHVATAQRAVAALMELWSNGRDPSLMEVLMSVATTRLFEIPDSLQAITSRSEAEQTVAVQDRVAGEFGDPDRDPLLDAWDRVLQAPFSQIESYTAYVSGKAPFGTHQGIKGLEFPRVLVVMDDDAARGFLFSYEKLFGAKPRSNTDLEHEQHGRDSSLDRTRRLLYVTCSRAEKSLALVAYTSNPEKVREYVLQSGWFVAEEVVMLG